MKITKEGFKYEVWNSISKAWEEEKPNTYLYCLKQNVTIENGVTLGDIFKFVDKDVPLKILLGEYSWCDVDAFHREAEQQALRKADLHYLELYSHFQYGEGFCLGFHGVGEAWGGKHPGNGNVYGIDMTPVNELIHLEVRLNNECKVIDEHHKEIGKCKIWYSLLDLLSEIYFEISFLGSPESRNETSLGLQDAIKEIESGEAKLVPWEEIKKKDIIQ